MAPNGNAWELSFEPVRHLINGLILHHIRYDSLKTPNGAVSMYVIFGFLNSWLQHIPEVYHCKYFSLVRNFITVNHKSVVIGSLQHITH